MPITFDCSCGKVLRVPDEHAGKRVKCPACNTVGSVPAPEPQFEVVEDEPQEQLAPRSAPARPVAKPAARRDEDDDEDDKPLKVAMKSRRDDDDEDEPRPKKKPKKKRRRDDDDDDYEHDRPRRRARSSGSDAGKKVLYVIGGLLLLLLGGGALFAGLALDTQKPIKAIVFGIVFIVSGLGTVVRGITGNFDE
jgi:hypothetical protein